MGKLPWLSDIIFPFLFEPAGKYPHNPFVGPRPMKFAYTMPSIIAKFPIVWYWRYSRSMRAFVYAFPITLYIDHKITQLLNSPANVEEWRIRRNQWYTKKVDPEDAYF